MSFEYIVIDEFEYCIEYLKYAVIDENFIPCSFLSESLFDGKPLNEVEKCEWILRWLSNKYKDMIEYLTKSVVVDSLEKNNDVQNELCRLDRVYNRNEEFFIEFIKSNE